MIKIKTDIKTFQKTWGYHGGKSEEIEMNWEDAAQFILDENRNGVHELLVGDQYRPYADLDWNILEEINAEDFDQLNVTTLHLGLKAMRELFVTDHDIEFYCASSYAKKKISGHYIVSGMYYTQKEHIKHVMMTCDMDALHFDRQVYDQNKTMRLPLCSKPGEDRPLRAAQIVMFKDGGFINYTKEDVIHDVKRGLITLINQDNDDDDDNDVLMPAPDGYIEKSKKKTDATACEKKTTWTDEQQTAAQSQLRKIIAAMAAHRASKRESWMQGVWAIRRVAEKYQQAGVYRAIAQEFAKKTDANNYNEAATDELFWAPVKEVGVGFTRLKEWADIDTPGWDVENSFCMIAGEEFDINVIKAKMKLVYNSEDLCIFKQETVAYMNQFYTLIKAGRHPFVIFETYEINDNVRSKTRGYPTIQTLKLDFENKTMIYQIGKKAEVFCPLKCWMSHPNRKEKDRVCFDPRILENFGKTADPRAYNLFDRLAISAEDCKDAADLQLDGPWLTHIMKRWCSHNVKLYNFVLNVFALQIQKPWVKHMMGLGCKSEEGAGKGLVLQPIFEIIGPKYVAFPSHSDQILGTFNAILEAKLIIFLDEMVWGGDKQQEGALKKLNTESRTTCNRKGIDAYEIFNPSNVIACSNEEWMLPASKKARRFQVLELDDELAGIQTSETSRIIKSIVATDTKSIAKFLYARDITNFNPCEIINTKALRMQKIRSMSEFDKTFLAILETGTVTVNGVENYISKASYSKTEFYKAIGAPMKFMQNSIFWTAAKKLFPTLSETRTQIAGKRTIWVQFPDIETMRNQFRQMYNDDEWAFDEADDCVDEGEE